MTNQCSRCVFYDPDFDQAQKGDYIQDGKTDEKHYCLAFPVEGIPEAIWTDKVDHTKGFEGDGGIYFVEA